MNTENNNPAANTNAANAQPASGVSAGREYRQLPSALLEALTRV
jgi:hypothetical protein